MCQTVKTSPIRKENNWIETRLVYFYNIYIYIYIYRCILCSIFTAPSVVWRGGHSWVPLLYHPRCPALGHEGGQQDHQIVLRLTSWFIEFHPVGSTMTNYQITYYTLTNMYDMSVSLFCFSFILQFFLVCSRFFTSTMKWTEKEFESFPLVVRTLCIVCFFYTLYVSCE